MSNDEQASVNWAYQNVGKAKAAPKVKTEEHWRCPDKS